MRASDLNCSGRKWSVNSTDQEPFSSPEDPLRQLSYYLAACAEQHEPLPVASANPGAAAAAAGGAHTAAAAKAEQDDMEE